MNYQDNISLPLLGAKTTQQIDDCIIQALVDETTAVDLCSRLLKEAPNQLHQEFIKGAIDDKLEHIDYFEKLYRKCFLKVAQYQIRPVTYDSYPEGILLALKDELEMAEFYRNVQLSTCSQLVRDCFYFAMVDELTHATQFSTLLNLLH